MTTQSEALGAWVNEQVTERFTPVPFKLIMAQAISMKTMARSRMYNEHGEWFMTFTFDDESEITYSIDG